jgi:hypothetical protein
MAYLDVALATGNTILVEDDRSPEEIEQVLGEKGSVDVTRVEIFDPRQKMPVTLLKDDVAGIARSDVGDAGPALA